MNQLTTNLATHRLTVKTMEGNKSFLLNAEQAKQVRANLNKPALQFIDFGGEAYPKFGCNLTKLSDHDLKKMRENFADYSADYFFAAQVIDGITRTIFLRKKIRKFSDSREEVLSEEKGYFLDGEFIPITND